MDAETDRQFIPAAVATAPVIRTCALIASIRIFNWGIQAGNFADMGAFINARNNPVRIKSMLRTETISPESSIAPSCAINRGRKGHGFDHPIRNLNPQGCATAPAPINNARISVKIRNIIFPHFTGIKFDFDITPLIIFVLW